MFLILFIVGAGFILLSAIFDFFVDGPGSPISIFQPKLIAIFLTVMGGVGLILTNSWASAPFTLILTISVFSGLFIAALLYRFVIIPLHRAQNTSAFDKQATIGIVAKIISPIPQGGYGKISYNISGSTVTSPAKSEDGGEVKNGEAVTIVYIEGGTYFVRKQTV